MSSGQGYCQVRKHVLGKSTAAAACVSNSDVPLPLYHHIPFLLSSLPKRPLWHAASVQSEVQHSRKGWKIKEAKLDFKKYKVLDYYLASTPFYHFYMFGGKELAFKKLGLTTTSPGQGECGRHL